MARRLFRRLERLEARSGGGWLVAEAGADWQGDAAAALGLTPSGRARLVVVSRYAAPEAPPRLVGPAAVPNPRGRREA